MKNFINKILTFGVVAFASVLVSSFFAINVYGTTAPMPQPAQGMPIVNPMVFPQAGGAAVGGQYDLQFTFPQPPAGPLDTRWTGFRVGNIAVQLTDPDSRALHIGYPDRDDDPASVDLRWSRFASQYYITFANRTTGGGQGSVLIRERDENFPTVNRLDHEEINSGTQIQLNVSRTMAHSSLYEINIEPQHYVPLWNPPTPGPGGGMQGGNFSVVPRVMNPAAAPTRTMIFMSDILVLPPTGRGNSVTVEWNNPLWTGGQSIIDAWEITLLDADANDAVITTILVDSDDLLTPATDRILSFTIEHDAITVGRSYNIAVEPFFDRNRPLRPTAMGPNAINHQFIIDGETYFISSRPRTAIPRFQSQVPALIMPELTIDQIGESIVNLNWPRLGSISIGRIEIEQWADHTQADTQEWPRPAGATMVVTIPAPASREITSWQFTIDPPEPRAWSIAVFDNAGNFLARSNIEAWVPGEVLFRAYSPELHLFAPNPTSIRLDWRAFHRPAHTDAERDALETPPHSNFPLIYGQRHYIDFNLFYDIYVADSWEALIAMEEPNYPGRMPSVAMLMANADSPIQGVPFLTYTVGTYVNADGETGQIEPNTVYFVRIIAGRMVDTQEEPLWSSYSSGTITMPPADGGYLLRPGMMSSPQLRATTNLPVDPPEITLSWDIRYIEIYAPRTPHIPGRVWESAAGVRDNNIVFGTRYRDMVGTNPWASFNQMLEGTTHLTNLRNTSFPLNTAQQQSNFFGTAGGSGALGAIQSYLNNWQPTTPPALRVQDLSNREFDIHVVPYTTIMAGHTSLDAAFEAYTQNHQALNWNRINPSLTNGVFSYSFTASNGVTLAPNTTYVILMLPRDSRLTANDYAFFPAYIVVTTPDQGADSQARPTTPVLFPHGNPPATDHSVTVRWRRVAGMEHELRWSETLTGGATAGTAIPWEYIYENHTLWTNPANGEVYYVFEITGLFFDTVHFVWVNATNPNYTGENATSGWSNPVDIRTLDIQPPPPPRNLGPASASLLNQHNIANNTDYRPIEPDALTISFMRVFPDLATGTPRATGGTASGGEATALTLGDVDALHTIRFTDLVVNRRYHVRARTILTVTRGTPLQRVFSYEIQVADNEDFLDPISYIIPPLVGEPGPNSRRAYSEWVYIGLTTGTSDDEYDGAFHPDQFPLPEQDWEITYDPTTQTLTWRFRTNQIGADGRPDQQVDQRFITRLVQQRVFTYTIDMTYFEGLPITNRVVEVPLSISRAFDERLITLEILTDEKALQIPPGAFNTAATRDLQMGIGSNYRITISAVEDSLPTLTPNTRYATVPQELRVQAITPTRTVRMDTFAQPVAVILPAADFESPEGTNAGLFFNGPAGGWQDIGGQRTLANTVRGTIQNPGTFAAIYRLTPPVANAAAENHPSTQAMQRVTSRMTITDMTQFNPSQEVTADEFNNIILALSNGRTSVTIGRSISNSDAQALRRGRMYAPQNLTNEIAMDILVRQYELRTRQILRPMATVGTVHGVASATPELQQNLLKAADIGFITGPFQPQGRLTMGDLMNMVDIIMLDAGM